MAKIDGRRLDHKALEYIRIVAVKRVVEDGEAPSDVMKSLGLCRTSIYPWLRKFEDKGWDALVEKIAQGPEPKLSEKHRFDNKSSGGFWEKTRANSVLTLACGVGASSKGWWRRRWGLIWG